MHQISVLKYLINKFDSINLLLKLAQYYQLLFTYLLLNKI